MTLAVLILFALGCFALTPAVQAVNPPPDGGYPGGNTAEGQAALFGLTTGGYNTAVGLFSLRSNTTSSFNTALGAGTLVVNHGDENTATGAAALFSNTTGAFNTAGGAFALFSDTTGSGNTAVGDRALFSNTTGGANTANGLNALFNNITGNNNTAVGTFALYSNTDGFDNSAFGWGALSNDIHGNANTAIGESALFFNTGDGNTATGFNALRSNTAGAGNTATGLRALELNDNGIRNTATGVFALNHNTTGGGNTAVGYQALATSTADSNTAVGNDALVANTTGGNNTAVGAGALLNDSIGGFNTALGAGALSNSNGLGNIGVGANAGGNIMGASNVICIGGGMLGADVSNTTWISNIYAINTISGSTLPVIVSDAGQLGTFSSSERFKKDIATMEKISEAILALRPVTFHYKSDTKSVPQFGLIAEEVAKVNPDLVVRDKDGRPYTVRYDQVNAMLLNEFLKEHRKVEEQQAAIAELQKSFQSRFAEEEKQIAALASGLQKVSAP